MPRRQSARAAVQAVAPKTNPRYVHNTSTTQAYKAVRRSKLAMQVDNQVLSLTELDGTVPGTDTVQWDPEKLAGASGANVGDLSARINRVCARRNEGHRSLLPYSRGGLNRGNGDTGLKGIARNLGLAVTKRHRYKALVNAVCAVKDGGKQVVDAAENERKQQYRRYADDTEWSLRHQRFLDAKRAARLARGDVVRAEKRLHEREQAIDGLRGDDHDDNLLNLDDLFQEPPTPTPRLSDNDQTNDLLNLDDLFQHTPTTTTRVPPSAQLPPLPPPSQLPPLPPPSQLPPLPADNTTSSSDFDDTDVYSDDWIDQLGNKQ